MKITAIIHRRSVNQSEICDREYVQRMSVKTTREYRSMLRSEKFIKSVDDHCSQMLPGMLGRERMRSRQERIVRSRTVFIKNAR